MALIKKLDKIDLEKNSTHQPVSCTFSIVEEDGQKLLQIDTYGSAQRKIKNKKSQSIRFSPEALNQLKDILKGF